MSWGWADYDTSLERRGMIPRLSDWQHPALGKSRGDCVAVNDRDASRSASSAGLQLLLGDKPPYRR